MDNVDDNVSITNMVEEEKKTVRDQRKNKKEAGNIREKMDDFH